MCSALLRAVSLQIRNRVQRVPLAARLGTLLVAASLLTIVPLVWGGAILTLASEHLLSVTVLMALQSALIVHLSRVRWTRYLRQGWLAGLPFSRQAQSVLIGGLVAAGCVALLLMWMIVALFAQARAHVDRFEALLLCAAVGSMASLPLAWWLRPRKQSAAHRSAPRIAGAPHAVAGLSSLSRWPLVQARVWLPPRLLARLSLAAVFLPMDIPASVALALLFLLILAAYLVMLLSATVRVTRDCSAWLRSTALPAGRLAWAVSWLVAVKQLQWTAIAAVLLIAMGVHPIAALRFAELWLAVASAALSIAAAHSRESAGVGLRLCLTTVLLGAAESLKQHLSIFVALLLSGWQLRRIGES